MKKETFEKIVERLDQLSSDELRQLFVRLSAERGLLQDVFDALRDGIVLFDIEGRASFTNKAALRIYACSQRELLNESFETLVGNTCTWADLQSSGVALTRDLQVNYPEERHYNFLMMPVAEGSEYLLIIQDDTETRAKDEANADAEQMNLLSFLASGVAHELGNPINSLGLNLQLMQRKLSKLTAEAQQALAPLLENSLAETRRLDTLIQQFLKSMRPSTLQRSTVQLNELLEQVLKVLEPEIAARNITLHTDYSEGLPELMADSAQLFQVFYNLIRNAYQSLSGAGGGITLRTLFNDQDVLVQISDGGCGISHEVLGCIYEPFRTTKKSGNGLGLLIVRRIVKEHGGSLAIASKPQAGTIVTITLPRAERVIRLLPGT